MGPVRTILDALASGLDIVELGHPLHSTVPALPTQPGFRSALLQRHGDRTFDGGLSAANEMIVMGTHVGTHVDAFCHISHDGRLHGGVDAAEEQRGGSFRSGSVDRLVPFVCRGVLLDVAGQHARGRLTGGYAVTADDLAAVERAGATCVTAGDVVCVRTGWGRNYGDASAYLGTSTGCPGLAESAARWLAERDVRAVGTDTLQFDAVPAGGIPTGMPCHRVLLVERQISILENLLLEEIARRGVTEFVFVAAPLRLVGATGSPLRPFALV
ncbi:cyclase family protein [Pseudonocardia dioxanivorans]|jgi:kynurenine formamidase|uniref:cyclase family protein n=1 Tax=Pseudonocardia dioxanivorans TaxID=240495 RepID=UPI000CD1FC47|nr:cyclase family protein [Pseudonocardia dioxanivorans]